MAELAVNDILEYKGGNSKWHGETWQIIYITTRLVHIKAADGRKTTISHNRIGVPKGWHKKGASNV